MELRELKDIIAGLALENQKTAAAQRKTEAAIASFIEETKAAQRKTEASQQKTEAAIASFTRETEASIASFTRETKAVIASFTKETKASQKQLRRELGGMGRTQGEIAEDLFGRSLIPLMIKRELVLDQVIQRLKDFGTKEYDVVGLNSTKVVLLEVKTKLRQQDVEDFLNEKLAAFRQDFPKYSDRDIIGAVGALVVKKEISDYATSRGLYVFTQNGEDNAEIVNPPDFKPELY